MPKTFSSGDIAYEPQNDVEAQAMERSWVPKEHFKGDPEQWVDAKEYLFRGQLMDQITNSNKTVKQLRGVVDKLSDFIEKNHKHSLATQKRNVLNAKAEAETAGDKETVATLEQELEVIEQAEQEDIFDSREERQQAFAEAHKEFLAENEWYNDTKRMKVAADKAGLEYIKMYPNATPEDFYSYVLEEVEAKFPEAFEKGSDDDDDDQHEEDGTQESDDSSTMTFMDYQKRSPVSKSKKPGRKSTVRNMAGKLSPEERRVAERFVKNGTFESVEEYAQALASSNK